MRIRRRVKNIKDGTHSAFTTEQIVAKSLITALHRELPKIGFLFLSLASVTKRDFVLGYTYAGRLLQIKTMYARSNSEKITNILFQVNF